MAERPISARPARPDEGGALTELSLRSKSHWGYDAPFLESARANLTIDAETIRSARIYVVEREGETIGFYGLLGEPPEGRLEWMFLEPEAIGRGYGRWMWSDAMREAKAGGFRELLIESDRFAEPFYAAMGATRIGATASPVDGAPLPLFKIELAPEGDLSGIAQPGRGLGAGLMADPAVMERLQELAGFPIVPGTLNVRLPRPLERGPDWRYVAATEISPDWETRTGQTGYFLALVLIAGRYRGLAFQADESGGPGYPSDLIELFSEVHLRSALGLSDGGPIAVSLRDL
jgi:GNAT superfamily N-acetyltransferase